jgi:Zn ribbon nucleic-acid-binding protein
MNSELPEFDHEATCPKCGSEDVGQKCVEDGNVMLRTCADCGWSWKELPLDVSFVENDEELDEDDEEAEEAEPEGACCSHSGNHCCDDAPKAEPAKDDLTMAREASKLLYAGNGFELRSMPDAVTPEFLEMVKKSKVVIGIPSNLL